jgi:hypothetical protein
VDHVDAGPAVVKIVCAAVCIYTIRRSESVSGVSDPSPPTMTSQPLLANLAD